MCCNKTEFSDEKKINFETSFTEKRTMLSVYTLNILASACIPVCMQSSSIQICFISISFDDYFIEL